MAPHGLILGEDEATPSRKLFKHLPGPPEIIFGPKMAATIENPKDPRPDARFGASKNHKILTKLISYKRYGKILFQKVA